MTRAEERMQRAFAALSRDQIKATYETEGIRRLQNRLELLEAGDAPDDAQEIRLRLETQLAEMRLDQSDSFNSENPCFDVVIVKPDPATKAQLDLLNRRVHAEQMALLRETEEPIIREGLREGARTTILYRSLYDTEEEVAYAVRDVLVDQLMALEQKTPEQLAVVSDYDPDLKLTEEEEDTLRVSDTLEGADLAHAMLERDGLRTNLLERKRRQIVANRLEDAEARRKELLILKEEQVLDRITWLELSLRGMMAAREENSLHALLFCVRDGSKPIHGRARGEEFVKGYEPFFESIQAVRDAAKGYPDFYGWLLALRDRLDYLTDEELYGLAEYEPFRHTLLPMLRSGRSLDQVADFLRQVA